jgi:putative oxidoreductase
MSMAETALPVRLRREFVAARAWLEQLPLSPILLAMRIAIGFVFFNSGLLKVRSFEFAVRLFRDEYQLPFIDPLNGARLATFVELTFPLFLIFGLGTRLATLPLLGMVAVIEIFVYPKAWVEHLLWASVLLMLLTRGPGKLSFDYLIERHMFATRRAQSP